MNAAIDESVDLDAARRAMVSSQLRTNAVSDPRIVAAMAMLPREAFLPGVPAALAYADRAPEIGRGRRANTPLATGRLLTEAYLAPADRVLLIGAAAGYAAAVLAELVASVVAVETAPDLVSHARRALASFANVELVEGPLPEGHVAGAPYDVLLIDGAVERLPDALVAQVEVGGRIVTGLVDRGVTRLAAGRRTAGGIGLVDFADAECVVLPGFAEPARFRF